MIRGSISGSGGTSVGSGSGTSVGSGGASVGSGGASVATSVAGGAHDATSPKTRVSATKMLSTRKAFIYFLLLVCYKSLNGRYEVK
ncbi:MAG: hypothetical protein B6I35_01085 [Anaerolineaceae bacterium 4572_32.2]|nr:MAG: hypothetical protein B6I35_01085 [Anaerolineaceae bacterium 4572_32.2]